MRRGVLLLLGLACAFSAYDPSQEPACLRYAFEPITAALAAAFIQTGSSATGSEAAQIQAISLGIQAAEIPGTETQAALFVGIPGVNKFFLRVRNCGVPDFSDAVCGSFAELQGRIVEVYCPACYSDDNVHIFTYVSNTLSSEVASVPLLGGKDYTTQFWWSFGSNLNEGWIQNSQIPELGANYTSDQVFILPVTNPSPYPGSSSLIAVVGGIRSATEPCNPPVACVVAGWSAWSNCSVECGGGFVTRSRDVVFAGQFGGADCGSLGDLQPCNTQQCPAGLSGKATTGVVIACVGAAILAAMMFCIWSERRPVFTNKPRKHRHDKQKQFEEHTASYKTSTADVAGKQSHPRTTRDDEEEAPAGAPKSVHIWV